MILDIVFLVLGLALIIYGANILTDGSSALARRMGMSDLVVGLTVVAFGTSSPELIISLLSAIDGKGALAIGNVVGSNIINILLIIGITALLHPIKVERTIMTREIPMVIISSVILLVMGNTVLLDGAQQSVLSRTSGIILLIFFFIFMWYTIASAKSSPELQEATPTATKKDMPLWKALVFTAVGLVMLVYGGDKFVDGATGIAKVIGISDAVIGLTIAAVGTSLPELATSVTAALKGKTDMAIGNVIGSNIFNIFVVLGVSATASPLAFGGIGNLDLLVMVGASVLFLIFGWFFGNRTFTRTEGLVMTLCYIAYILVKI